MQRLTIFGVLLVGLAIALAVSFRSVGLWALPTSLVPLVAGLFCLFVSAWRDRRPSPGGSSHGDDAALIAFYTPDSPNHSHGSHDGHGSQSLDHGGGDGGHGGGDGGSH